MGGGGHVLLHRTGYNVRRKVQRCKAGRALLAAPGREGQLRRAAKEAPWSRSQPPGRPAAQAARQVTRRACLGASQCPRIAPISSACSWNSSAAAVVSGSSNSRAATTVRQRGGGGGRWGHHAGWVGTTGRYLPLHPGTRTCSCRHPNSCAAGCESSLNYARLPPCFPCRTHVCAATTQSVGHTHLPARW